MGSILGRHWRRENSAPNKLEAREYTNKINMAELQLLKSITRRRQERQDMEIQMFLKKKNQSRKRLLQDMDEELDVAQALGLSRCRSYEETKERTKRA